MKEVGYPILGDRRTPTGVEELEKKYLSLIRGIRTE